MSEAKGWRATRVRQLLGRRLERLDMLCRYEPDRLDWLEEEAGVIDGLVDLLIELEPPALAFARRGEGGSP